jgi:hypothetical protein
MLTQPLSGLAAGAADFYLALVVPGGAVYIFDGTNWALLYDGAQLFPAAAKPFRVNAAVMNSSEIVLDTHTLVGTPPGAYFFAIVLVRAGTDPNNTANWLTAPGEVPLNF